MNAPPATDGVARERSVALRVLRFTVKEANEKRIATVEIERPKKEAITSAQLG